jgi:hypothetical protein
MMYYLSLLNKVADQDFYVGADKSVNEIAHTILWK